MPRLVSGLWGLSKTLNSKCEQFSFILCAVRNKTRKCVIGIISCVKGILIFDTHIIIPRGKPSQRHVLLRCSKDSTACSVKSSYLSKEWKPYKNYHASRLHNGLSITPKFNFERVRFITSSLWMWKLVREVEYLPQVHTVVCGRIRSCTNICLQILAFLF